MYFSEQTFEFCEKKMQLRFFFLDTYCVVSRAAIALIGFVYMYTCTPISFYMVHMLLSMCFQLQCSGSIDKPPQLYQYMFLWIDILINVLLEVLCHDLTSGEPIADILQEAVLWNSSQFFGDTFCSF